MFLDYGELNYCLMTKIKYISNKERGRVINKISFSFFIIYTIGNDDFLLKKKGFAVRIA